MSNLDPRIARLKEKLLTAPYEICMARAKYFTEAYAETEGLDPALRNAEALRRTLANQKIFIWPEEYIAGSKTEHFLAGPLSVERGDFLRTLQLEMDCLHLKHRPFKISEEDRKLFYEKILPYWDGRTLRDRKAEGWKKRGLLDAGKSLTSETRNIIKTIKWWRYLAPESRDKMIGANKEVPLTLSRIKTLRALRYELAYNNPSPALVCFDVQGHLSLGVDKVVQTGMEAIMDKAKRRMEELEESDPEKEKKKAFLQGVIISLQAAIDYAERFASLAEKMAEEATMEEEKSRLLTIVRNCHHVPRFPPRTFHEALQAAWFTLLIGEIQYGTHEVFAVGRMDQYLYPYYINDIKEGRLTREQAKALLQEFYLKQTANVEPIPEIGMETNSVLGNSQHVVTIGGVTPEGKDATNELTFLMLEAFEEMNGSVNQLSVRISEKSPPELLKKTVEVLGTTSGIAIYNDGAIIPALIADGMTEEDARDYCIVGCIETSGQSNTHGCPGGHEIVLPVVLWLTLSRGRLPPPGPGQKKSIDCGDPETFKTFDDLLRAFRKQLTYQISILIAATEEKDRAYRDFLPAPYVSALMDDCIEKAKDITDGGARYDFTSIDVRGLATLVDSLLAIRYIVYEKKELDLPTLIKILRKNFKGYEVLRQRLIHEPPKYGVGNPEADELALKVVEWISDLAGQKPTFRGGHYRVSYYSYGNHVIDGIMLDATPDGRLRGEPISNGISPSNLVTPEGGPTSVLLSASRFPPEQISSGVALNVRIHPSLLKNNETRETVASMINTYFRMGGMHIQPNVVSTETLRSAQQHPEKYRDLVIKVSGYSAYFVDLGRSIQEDIISRTEFGK